MLKKEYIPILFCLIIISTLILFNLSRATAAIENSPHTEESSTKPATAKDNDDEWEYIFEDRPDPFLPFIQPKVATTNIPEEEEVILTGMQLFEPGQLKLVAIMFSSKSKVAMVEDVTGKGYIINEGMLIGRYGVVSQISLDQVNITETRKVAGKDVVTPVVMRLNKEGDK